MQYTLHLTNACNLTCTDCGGKKAQGFTSRETAPKVINLALADPGASIGIGFFGGEPVL
ncbi:MAG: hypothetical protein LBJ12_09165 [Oscillospiraceae bacterium]|nr:hypothetical protein [Oscillospiraceae bacterium]